MRAAVVDPVRGPKCEVVIEHMSMVWLNEHWVYEVAYLIISFS